MLEKRRIPRFSPGSMAAVLDAEFRVDVDSALSEEVCRLFQDALRKTLDGRPGVLQAQVRSGRDAEEVLVLITSRGRRAPLPLFFPRAGDLDPEDVARIVGNVLEGMGPAFGSA